jgi:hypothetical protein
VIRILNLVGVALITLIVLVPGPNLFRACIVEIAKHVSFLPSAWRHRYPPVMGYFDCGTFDITDLAGKCSDTKVPKGRTDGSCRCAFVKMYSHQDANDDWILDEEKLYGLGSDGTFNNWADKWSEADQSELNEENRKRGKGKRITRALACIYLDADDKPVEVKK